MRTQEAAIKARAVTFRPRPSTGPRPEHSEGAGGGCPQWPGESPPQAPRLRWPRARLWGPVPPEEKKQRRRQAPPHGAPASRELPAVSGTGSPSRRGEASCHPCQAALLLRRRPLEPSTKTSTAPSGPAGWAGPGRAGGRLPAEQRPPCGGRQHKAQGPTSAPRPRVLSDGTLKMLLKGEKCLSVPRGPRGPLRAPGAEPTAARLLPPRKDAGPPPAPRLPQQTTGGRRPHLGPLDGERGSSMRAPDHGGPHAPQSDTQRVTCGGQ